MPLVGINAIVAVLGAVLALSSYMVLKQIGAPDKICVGGGILSALVVAIFWSCVMLGTGEDEDD
jgi:precorrin-6B methylase 2